MGWSGGTYTRTNGTYSGSQVWQDDDANGFGIDADRHDTHDEDLANGINNCLAKDGQNAATGDIPFGGNKATGLGDATAAKDAMNRDASDARYFRRDGGNAATSDIPFGSNKATGLADPTSAQDAATKAYCDIGSLTSWAACDGGSSPTLYASEDVSSVDAQGTSDFVVTFSTAAPATNQQAVTVSADEGFAYYQCQSATQVRVTTMNTSNTLTRRPFSIHRKV